MFKKSIGQLFRLNLIRNHYIRFGLKGIVLFLKLLFVGKSKTIVFRHREFKYPIHLRKKSSDISTFYHIIFNLQYDIPVSREPDIILDLGANIGLAGVCFLNKYPQSTVIAVEPEESNFKMLQLNAGKYSNFFSYQKAIWNKPALLEIKENELGKWAFTVSDVPNPTGKTVETITINQIIEQHSISRIDILKIDIEGSEIELFSNNYESWLPITKMIIIELHDWMRDGCSKQFFSTLTKYNFKLSHKGENLICYMN